MQEVTGSSPVSPTIFYRVTIGYCCELVIGRVLMLSRMLSRFQLFLGSYSVDVGVVAEEADVALFGHSKG